jgi:hypothetical protein
LTYKYSVKGLELLGRQVILEFQEEVKRCELNDVLSLGRIDRVEIESADSRPIGSIEEKLFGDSLCCLKIFIILRGIEGTVDVTLHCEVEWRVRVRVEGVGLSPACEKKLYALHLTSIKW